MAVYLDESVQNYLDWLKTIKKAPYHTYRAYVVDLQQFLKYFLRNELNNIPSKEEITDYILMLKEKYNYSTYRRKVTALRNFITYLIESGVNAPDPFITISLPVPKINFDIPLRYEDILNIIEELPEHELNEIRDKLIFSLIAKSGLTVRQLRELKLKDINFATNQIIISKNQLTFTDDQISRLIEKYLDSVKKQITLSLEDFLLSNTSKIPLSTRTINLIIDKIGSRFRSNTRLSPTILRRLFARNLKERNISAQTQKLILGEKCTLAN